MCHFWSNFEIARLDWFRSKEYSDFFQTMDRSGGFWMERVSFIFLTRQQRQQRTKANCTSGVMRLFTRSRLELCSASKIFITSVILDTAIRRFNIVLPMRLHDNCLMYHTFIPARWTRSSSEKKTSTGRRMTTLSRMAWGVGAVATRTLLKSKAKTAHVLPNGSMLLVDGLVYEASN